MNNEEFKKRYEIDIKNGRLGGGAFGTVYKAYDNILDTWKAIKISEVKYVGDKEFSLVDEFNATKDLKDHKNIANYEAVYQFEEPNGIFDYAIMQYYEHGNLKQLLGNYEIQYKQQTAIINGLIRGIHFLHSNQVIHRDLKPSNILISKKGKQYIPKIADFGLSKSIDTQELSQITNSFGGGTLEYSSPEQLLGQKLRYNADLWSLGVIIYEIIFGITPFNVQDSSLSGEYKRRMISRNIINSPIPEQVEKLEEPYRSIVRQCLIKEPSNRIHSSGLIINELEKSSETQILSSSEIKKIINEYTEGNTEILSASELLNIKQQAEIEKQKILAAKIVKEEETARKLEQHKKEQERLEREREERERLEQESKEQQRIERERIEKEKLEHERKEQEILKLEKKEQERLVRAREQQKRLERQRKEQERLEKEKKEQQRVKKESLEREKLEQERIQKEIERKEQRKIEEQRKKQKQSAQVNRVEEKNQTRNKALEASQKEVEDFLKNQKLKNKRRKRRIIFLLIFFPLVAGSWFFFSKMNPITLIDQTGKTEIKKSAIDDMEKNELREFLKENPFHDLSGYAKGVLNSMENKSIEKEWFSIKNKDDIKLTTTFLSKYPNSPYSNQAKDHLTLLLDRQNLHDEGKLWAYTSSNPNIELLSNFIEKFPESRQRTDAQDMIAQLKLSREKESFEQAKKSNDKANLIKFLSDYPESTYAFEAQGLLDKMVKEEEKDYWMPIMQSNDIELLKEYISKDRLYKNQAQLLLEELLEKQSNKTNKQNSLEENASQTITKGEPQSLHQEDQTKGEDSTQKESEIDIAAVEKAEDIIKESESPKIETEENENNPIDETLPELIMSLTKNEKNIPAGGFMLGCDEIDKKCEKDEGSGYYVNVNSFYISKYEVTQKEFQDLMGFNPSRFVGCKSCPVENVSWNEVMEYINKLNSLKGNPYTYRLPTETEWEYAATGGNHKNYSGSDEIDQVAQYTANANSPQPRGKKKANGFGLYDMSGNVAEWCKDWYFKDAYSYPLGKGKGKGKGKVVRGGSWNDKAKDCRVNARHQEHQERASSEIGFRLVRDLK